MISVWISAGDEIPRDHDKYIECNLMIVYYHTDL